MVITIILVILMIIPILSCAIYTHTPARKVIQTSSCTISLYNFVLQTGLGMGMGINGTAHSNINDNANTNKYNPQGAAGGPLRLHHPALPRGVDIYIYI